MRLTILYLIPTILRSALVKPAISTMEPLASHVVLLLPMLALVAPLRVCVSAAKPILHSPMVIVFAKVNITVTTRVRA